jgi:hypothetical protein
MGILSVRAKGPLELLLRLVALILVFGLSIFAFWKNSERKMTAINASFGLSDETKSLTADERARVQDFITALRRDYGLEARVQIAEDVLAPPKADGKTLYLGLSARSKTAVVQLPPLVARALGPEFAKQMETEHFPFHFGPGRDWRKGLVLALDLIESRLAALNAETAESAARPKKGQHTATRKDTK